VSVGVLEGAEPVLLVLLLPVLLPALMVLARESISLKRSAKSEDITAFEEEPLEGGSLTPADDVGVGEPLPEGLDTGFTIIFLPKRVR